MRKNTYEKDCDDGEDGENIGLSHGFFCLENRDLVLFQGERCV